ncbi:hypothetical protein C8R27_10750 [Nitrosomonas ureae]|nr:hypothetical protein C8R27_10750 [Nitrosomonas ureae]
MTEWVKALLIIRKNIPRPFLILLQIVSQQPVIFFRARKNFTLRFLTDCSNTELLETYYLC